MKTTENNFTYLLVAMIVLVIGLPIARELTGIDIPILRSVVHAAVLVIIAGSMQADPAVFRAGVGLVALGVLLYVQHVFHRTLALEIAALLCMFVFLLLMIAIALRQVVTGLAIDRNRIIGSVGIYLLIGVLWAIVYRLLYMIAPASFPGLAASEANLEDFIYFSFVTLTTLGYGDILPVTGVARSLAIFETISGQLYVAILIAGLVGAYIARQIEQKS